MMSDCDPIMPLEKNDIPAGIGDYFMQWKDSTGRLNLDVSL